MKPEVLAWALLFVVASGLAYRFFAWVLTRTKRSESAKHMIPAGRPEPIRVTDEHSVEPGEPKAKAPAASVSPASPADAVADVQTTENPAQTIPAPSVLETESPPPLSSVAPAEFAALSRPPPLAPDVRATLAPTIIATAFDVLPNSIPLPRVLVAAMTAAGANVVVLPSGEPNVTIRRRGTRLRARKIGQETPPLDARIKETLTRRSRPATKTRRKPATVRDQIEPAILGMIVGRVLLGPESARRIGRKPADGDPFASTKAATKIIGVPPRNPRVRFASAHIE